MRSLILFIFHFSFISFLSAGQTLDRGFVHPGGLHTQADFDRVKSQLASGNEKVVQAYNVLRQSEYSQSSVQTWPTETIVRGGSGENYMNAARGAAMAYQNALRWKIGGTADNADAAVRILMQWARTTKAIGGDSNYALAAGLYGYQFAQAAELMRDYDGWSREDFEKFRLWMLDVWYPSAMGFLRGRNGTWENAGRWWRAPGHYWSNWGLCNALCVASIGILCDDVFIYNQGMSFFKYDQCGTFRDPRIDVPIMNDGLTEFLGNFVVTTFQMENEDCIMDNGDVISVGGYGKLGQLNESGRDAGHSSMSLGVALDIAKVGWSQGDDLFAYMDHRLAAGIEYLAAQSLSVEGLPWTNYHYATSGYYYSDSRSWLMTEPVLGAQMRPYWGTVIGIYEGVKGVRMPFAERAYANMGIDGGGAGATSGGYDHLGFSVLMNTRDEQLCPPENTPTELSPTMIYSDSWEGLLPSLDMERNQGNIAGSTSRHNELGGLVNNYYSTADASVPRGRTITLLPQLDGDEEDTGLWLWDTGETTRAITISTDRSRIYRVTYTNGRGIKSQLCFPIAVSGDGILNRPIPYVAAQGVTVDATELLVPKGTSVTLGLRLPANGGTPSAKWSDGSTGSNIVIPSVENDVTYTATYTVEGESVCQTFTICTAQPLSSMPQNVENYYYMIYSAESDAQRCLSLQRGTHQYDGLAAVYSVPATNGGQTGQLWMLEPNIYGDYCIRNLSEQTHVMASQHEWDFKIVDGGPTASTTTSRYRLIYDSQDGFWIIRNVGHGDFYCGLWENNKDFSVGKELAANRTFDDADHLHFYAIPRTTYKQVFQTQTADVNCDGQITKDDVAALANIILGKDSNLPHQYSHRAADVNRDGAVSIADVTSLSCLIIESLQPNH